VAKDAGFFESFRIGRRRAAPGVQGISDIITIPGVINSATSPREDNVAGMATP